MTDTVLSIPSTSSNAIAIPRVLWWFREWPFWKTFLEGLGCRVVTNDPTRPTPRRRDRICTIVEESCYPMQLLLDRTLALANAADAVFLPRLISVRANGILCPRFAGVPDIVRIALEGTTAPRPTMGQGLTAVGWTRHTGRTSPTLLSPIVDAREGRRAVRNAYLTVAEALGADQRTARIACRHAAAVQQRFDAELEQRINLLSPADAFNPQIPLPETPPSTPDFRIALLGHPYITFDWEFNLGIIAKLRSLSVWVVPTESVPSKRADSAVRKLDKNVYWISGREALGSALFFLKRGGIDGIIYLSCFKCGVDGLLLDVVKSAARRQTNVPYLALTLDGHDNEVGLMTRLEAFVDIVRRPNK
ncbi:MAG: acyl-CoA dehydratase activase-related protein [Candidatus Sumerlaeia bacterium]|nr:acyl-CoA dehydratase activase-related protein [Candidatus Sumerlaeia bacterium]